MGFLRLWQSVSRRDDLVLAAVDKKGAKTQQPQRYGFSLGLFYWINGE
jgi:hypothetical protein